MITARCSTAGALYFLACLLAAPTHAASDTRGREFILAFPPNVGINQNLSLFIASEEDARGTVQIPGLDFVKPFSVTPEGLVEIPLPTAAQDLRPRKNTSLAVNVVSDKEITVHALNQKTNTTDGFTALPTDTLGMEYLALSYTRLTNEQIVVVAAHDDTEVNIADEVTVTLNRNDVYYHWDHRDLTGTRVEASAPVALLSGSFCTYIPHDVGACDHTVEMMPPVATWGTSFLTVPLATRLRGDLFRVLAARDGTIVFLNGAEVAHLDRGEHYETLLTTRSHIETTEPVLVGQYALGQSFDRVDADPFMMLVPPPEQFLRNYTFRILGPEADFEKGFVNVVVPAADILSLELDGAEIDPSLFQPIRGTGFSGAQIALAPGSHNLRGDAPFGLLVYGFRSYESYGYPGGMFFDAADTHGDRYPPNLTLLQIDETIQGVASDNEDLNLDGTLEPEEDLNGNGSIDRRSEDLNANGRIDDGEDNNGDGVLDRDTGIFRLELAPGSSNLRLEVHEFLPGSLQTRFTLSLLDPREAGSGTLVITDGASNRIERALTLSTTPMLTQVRVVSTLSVDGVELDVGSFNRAPQRIETTSAQTRIEWRFDQFAVDQLEALTYDILLRDPGAGEHRLVTRRLEVFYTDVNGHEVRTELAEQAVSVLPSIYQIDLATDKNRYSANEAVGITARVTNLSEFPATVALRFLVTDDAGVPVIELGTLAAVPLDAGETRTLTAPSFYTGTLLAGEYQLLAEVLDRAGAPPARAEAFFSIQAPTADKGLRARVSTDKPTYECLELVQIEERITNLTPNAILNGLSALTRVHSPDGGVFWSERKPLRELLPGSRQERVLSVAVGQAPPGTYRVTLQIIDAEDTAQAVAETTFSLRATADSGAGLVGALSAAPDQVWKHDSVSLLARLDNGGNSDVTDLPLTLALVDPEHERIETEWSERLASLKPGDSYIMARNWTAAGDVGSSFVALLSVEVGGEIRSLARDRISIVGGIDAALGLSERGRVLVLLEAGESDHESDDGFERPEEVRSSDAGSGSRRLDDETADLPRRLDSSPWLSAKRDMLGQLLAEAGWSYTLVSDAERFTRELRQGGYNAYLLLSDAIKLPEQVQRELREAVYRGEGLIVTGPHQGPNNHLAVPLGIRYTGRRPDAVGLNLHESELHCADQSALLLPGSVAEIELVDATAVGDFTLADGALGTALTVNAYGDGHTVFAGLDLLAEATATGADSLPARLLLNALEYAQPAPPPTVTEALVPVYLSVENEGIATAGRAIVRLPSNAALETSSAAPRLLAQPDGTLLWPFDLAQTSGERLTLWLRLPPVPKPVVVDVQIQTGVAPQWREDDELSLELEVEAPPGLNHALSDLADLAAQDKGYARAYRALAKAQRALSAGDAPEALQRLVKVADTLIKIGTSEALAVRSAVAEAMRRVALAVTAL